MLARILARRRGNPPPKHILQAAQKYNLGEANLDAIRIVEV